MELTAVAKDAQGRRFEMTLTAPDDFQNALDVNEAERRLRFALQREVTRAAQILTVAEKDREMTRNNLVQGGKRGLVVKRVEITDPGPDQIAFAGTKKSLEIPVDGSEEMNAVSKRTRKER